MTAEAIPPAAHHQPWCKILHIQVLIAIALGILVEKSFPDLGKDLRPLGDGFIALIKMMIAPVIFLTVVYGSRRGARAGRDLAGRCVGFHEIRDRKAFFRKMKR